MQWLSPLKESTLRSRTPSERPDSGSLGETVHRSRRTSNVHYGSFHAVTGRELHVPKNRITALIGPSGCGKSTVLRCINRMNDLVPGARVEGEILYHGVDLNSPKVDPVEVRRRIGMVFQKPNPFPKSIYDNVAWGARINGIQGQHGRAGRALPAQAALWDEVKDKLQGERAGALGRTAAAPLHRADAGDQSRGDPDGRAVLARWTRFPRCKIEDLMRELSRQYTIVIVTHNMQQAARVSDQTVFFSLNESGRVSGRGRADQADVHQSARSAHRGLHHRPIRLAVAGIEITNIVRDRNGR